VFRLRTYAEADATTFAFLVERYRYDFSLGSLDCRSIHQPPGDMGLLTPGVFSRTPVEMREHLLSESHIRRHWQSRGHDSGGEFCCPRYVWMYVSQARLSIACPPPIKPLGEVSVDLQIADAQPSRSAQCWLGVDS
jgi:hypothetical protein